MVRFQHRFHGIQLYLDQYNAEDETALDIKQGVHDDGETIAVKMLHHMPGLDDQQFEKEYLNLASLQHHNIVKLVGYCHETQREYVPYNGKMVLCDKTNRALCFEYMQNGSLDNFLQDEFSGHNWDTRYAVIKGICDGLKYLHEELQPPIYHLDLKPANILLDENMTAKIADFGLSKLYGDGLTQITTSSVGTFGYLPPEYIDRQLVSNKLDIFSLGVIIIKIMTGHKGYSQIADMSAREFIDHVHANWRNRLQETSSDALESYAEQVKTCIQIALSCVESDRHNRPSIGDIISKLNETETLTQLSRALVINPGGSTSGGKLTKLRTPTKVGSWGGLNIGTMHDIDDIPQRLRSMTIRSGDCIDTLSFSYINQAGKIITAGPWGGGRGRGHPTIVLGPSEILKEVSGTVYQNEEVCSLKFVTNVRTYGPYGGRTRVPGYPFSAEVPEGNSIVGFFVRSSHVINSIGIYMM
ncbi:putative receptor-like protein kinase At4g00960 [Triticum dicoccoides]|uniref:putative receptor-like protein kinase At4g00960 n=1 Tax=Triticum dicoccoides TaxID=85692 RepID=UPI00188F8B98|nr:putative receptor-like protein kinase At4g00960 [Triticum dicoccoides]